MKNHKHSGMHREYKTKSKYNTNTVNSKPQLNPQDD